MTAVRMPAGAVDSEIPVTRYTSVGVGTRRAFAEGARAQVPMAMGVAPFGLAIGAAVSASNVPAPVGWLGAPLIMAGSAQLTAVEMLDAGAAPLMIVVSALVINARIVMYSAAMAPWFRDEPLLRRLVLAIPLIDQMYLVSAPRFEQGDLGPRARQAYWVGGASVLCGTWVTTQAVAIAAGASLPEGVGLHVAAPLALAGLLAKTVSGRPTAVAAAVAALVAVAGIGLPFQASVLLASVSGVVAGAVAGDPASKETS